MRKTVLRLIKEKVINGINTMQPGLKGKQKAFAIKKGMEETKKNYHKVGKPSLPKPIFSKKRHEKESYPDFKRRRTASNKRRRGREAENKLAINMGDPTWRERNKHLISDGYKAIGKLTTPLIGV